MMEEEKKETEVIPVPAGTTSSKWRKIAGPLSFSIIMIISLAGSPLLIYLGQLKLGQTMEPVRYQFVVNGVNVFYYVHFYAESHEGAQARCLWEGMKLLSIKNPAEDAFVTLFLEKHLGPNSTFQHGIWWISAYEKATGSNADVASFAWTSSNTPMDYTNFCADEDQMEANSRDIPRALAKDVFNPWHNYSAPDDYDHVRKTGCWSQVNVDDTWSWEGNLGPFICENL